MISGPFGPSGLVLRVFGELQLFELYMFDRFYCFWRKSTHKWIRQKALNPRGSVFFWQTAAHGQGNQWTWMLQVASVLKRCNERRPLGSVPRIQPI